jgi:L-arabinose isomerase
MVTIGPETTLSAFRQDLRANDVYYYLAQGFRA